MKYMVMECRTSYAVLLDEEGRFLKAANLSYEVGQVVYNPVLMKLESGGKTRMLRRAGSGLAAAAACFLMVVGINYYRNFMAVYSSIFMSINPHVQMDLNRRGFVVRLTGTNEDGKELLEGYNGKGKDKAEAADDLLDLAIEKGFLSEGGMVSFSIDAPDDVLFQEYGVELRTAVSGHLEGRMEVQVEVLDHRDQPVASSLEPDETPAVSPSLTAEAETSEPVPESSAMVPQVSEPEPSVAEPERTASRPKPVTGNDTDYEPDTSGGGVGYGSGDTDYGLGGGAQTTAGQSTENGSSDYDQEEKTSSSDYGPGGEDAESSDDGADEGGDSGYQDQEDDNDRDAEQDGDDDNNRDDDRGGDGNYGGNADRGEDDDNGQDDDQGGDDDNGQDDDQDGDDDDDQDNDNFDDN